MAKQTYDDPSGYIMTLPSLSLCPGSRENISSSYVVLGVAIYEGDTSGCTKRQVNGGVPAITSYNLLLESPILMENN